MLEHHHSQVRALSSFVLHRAWIIRSLTTYSIELGIGKVLAERIVEYRENEQAYKTVDDLLNVKGIGKATLEKIRDHVTVGEGS